MPGRFLHNLPPRGLEQENVTGRKVKKLGNPPKSGGAESGAQSAEKSINQTNRLAVITDLLADLPADQRKEIISELEPDDRVSIARLLVHSGRKDCRS